MMELKVYQRNALDAFSRWLETLEGAFNAAGTMVVRDSYRWKGIFQLVFNDQEFLEITARLNDDG